MASTATPLTPSSVIAELFPVGIAEFEQATEQELATETKTAGQMMPEQEPNVALKSEIQVRFVVAAPGGPLLSMPSALPTSLRFGAFNDPQYRLRKAIPLEVTFEEGNVVVNWVEIDEFGVGTTLSGAISDFAYSLRDLYRNLSKNENLGPDLVNINRILGDYIEARPR